MWTVLLTTIRKARNHCQDETTVRMETTVRIETPVKMDNEHADDQDQWSALKYN